MLDLTKNQEMHQLKAVRYLRLSGWQQFNSGNTKKQHLLVKFPLGGYEKE